jgi:hypothetical protein
LGAPGLDFQTWDWNVECGSVPEVRWLGFSNPMSPKGETWGTRASFGGGCGPPANPAIHLVRTAQP